MKFERLGLMMIGASLLVIATTIFLLLDYQRDFQLSQIRAQGISLARVLQMDLSQHGETNTGEMTSQFTYDMNTLVVALRNLFTRATVEPLKMAACLIGAGIICWRLLLVSLILAPVEAINCASVASPPGLSLITAVKRHMRPSATNPGSRFGMSWEPIIT